MADPATTPELTEQAYHVLNHAEHFTLSARLAAVHVIFKHGTASDMGELLALDLMAQGIAFICEALAKQELERERTSG
jgi:hypothetical protein